MTEPIVAVVGAGVTGARIAQQLAASPLEAWRSNRRVSSESLVTLRTFPHLIAQKAPDATRGRGMILEDSHTLDRCQIALASEIDPWRPSLRHLDHNPLVQFRPRSH